MSSPSLLRVAAIVAASLLLMLAYQRNVNWDEFLFLSRVHAYQDGRLLLPLQTIYVHAFAWLTRLPGHEMGQIFVARLAMTLLLATTVYSIHRVSRVLAGREAADIAALAYICSGFVLAHGTSFRADPIAAACLMGALAIMMTGALSRAQIAGIALLCSAAALVTIKSVLYAPAFLGVLIWRWCERRVVWRILCAWLIGVGLAIGLYLWHTRGLPSSPQHAAAAYSRGALQMTILEAGILPRLRELQLWLVLSVASVALSVLGLGAAASARERSLRLAFVLPLIMAALFYRNAFPYFFPFISPPLMVVAATGASRLGRGPLLGALVWIMLASGAAQAHKALAADSGRQRDTLTEIHRLFPEPVPYIDANAMVSSFPHQGFFMSTWGLARYQSQGRAIMAELIAREAPPLLLANRGFLYRTLTDAAVREYPTPLLADDQRALRDTYVQYAGVIWLAGKDIILDPEPQTIDFAIPGRYRVQGETPTVINGRTIGNGAVLVIDDAISVAGPSGAELRLIWDAPGGLDAIDLPAGGLFAGFWQLRI